ncbi:O-antigen ligase family protein [Synechococcus elongatus]|uniref:O-antigen ligase family protein n=1 Tax=Synechococcus elongatus TaxID=32046 RepID=UPI000F7D954B|nr:O-antigen ligase family protein [Synechococcus elongatus]
MRIGSILRQASAEALATTGILAGVALAPYSPILAGLAVVPALGWSSWQQRSQLLKSPLNQALLALSGLLLLSALVGTSGSLRWLGLANFLPFFWLLAVAPALLLKPSVLRSLLWILAIGSIPVCCIGYLQLYANLGFSLKLGIIHWVVDAGGRASGRMDAFFGYPNWLAAYLLMPWTAALGFWGESLSQRRWRRWLGLSLLLSLLGGCLLLTDSRNAWIVAGAIALVLALYEGLKWLVWGGIGYAIAILWAAFGPTGRDRLRQWIPAFFWARFSGDKFADIPRSPAESRLHQWQFAWQMTEARPWLGWGSHSFTQQYETATQVWLGHPHNLVLMFSAEFGLPATLLFLGILGSILGRALWIFLRWSVQAPSDRQDQRLLLTLLLACLGCAIFNTADVTVFDVRNNLLSWIVLAALQAATTTFATQRSPGLRAQSA